MLCTAIPCPAEGDEIWVPDFDKDGMASSIAAKILHSKRWGFINKNGTFVVQPKYDLVKSFSDGIMTVYEQGKYFKIDRSGKVLGPPLSRAEIITESNERRWAREAAERAELQKQKYKGIIYDATGQKRICDSSEASLSNFYDDLAACQISEKFISLFDEQCQVGTKYGESVKPKDRKINKFGYINRQGHMVIAPRFWRAEDFKDGVAKVEHWIDALQPNPDLAGFIDKSGDVIGGRYYDAAWSFEDGFGIIEKHKDKESDAEDGFIAKSGREMVGDFQEVYPFSAGLAAVRNRDGLWGFINTKGETVITPQFSIVDYHFAEGLLYVKNSDGKYGFIDKTGNFAIAPSFADADEFADGLAAVAIDVPEDEKARLLSTASEYVCGYIDTVGKPVINCSFFGARHFSEGLAAVQKGLRWGFIDGNGKLVIEAVFDDALPFSEGLAAVLKDGKWGFIDHAGQYKIAPRFPSYDDARQHPVSSPLPFSEGVTLACEADYNWHFIGRDGHEHFPMPVRIGKCGEPIAKPFAEGLAAVPNQDIGLDFSFIDHKGNLLIKGKIESPGAFSEGLAAAKGEGPHSGTMQLPDPAHFTPPAGANQEPAKFGYINRSGQFIVDPQYDEASLFQEGLAPVANGQYVSKRRGSSAGQLVWISKTPPGPTLEAKWGFINHAGQLLIEQKFDSANSFTQGLAGVRVGDRWGFIDKSGIFVIEPKFELVKPFSDGIAVVKLNGKYGCVNRKGELVIPLKFWLCGSFSNGRALVVEPSQEQSVASTDQTLSKPVKTQGDLLEFLIQRGGAPDESAWAGWKH